MTSQPPTNTDHRSQPRRRGEALHAAIFQATLEELAAGGYAALSMEKVAERARASKASLYRRWPTRLELVMDTVYHILPDPSAIPDTGELRGDLLAALRHMAAFLAGPAGEALRGVLGDALSDPARTADLRRRSQGNSRRIMEEIARRAVERGEIAAEYVTPRRVLAGQALLRHYFLFDSGALPDELIVQIVDEVVLPLFRSAVPRNSD